MKRLISLLAVAAVFAGIAAPAQAPSTNPPDALTLLQQVSKLYADATSYLIKATEERTSSNEWEHSWYRFIFTAAQAPGNRYHFEAQSSSGTGLLVSDGKTEWIYEAPSHLYLQKPTPADGPDKRPPPRQGLIVTFEADHLWEELANLGKRYKSATLRPDEVVSLEGRRIPCFVVRVTTLDLKRPPRSDESSSEDTIWIDKSTLAVVKQLERGHTNVSYPGDVHVPIYAETVTTYPVTELNLQNPDLALFAFTPPQDAKLVDKFPEHKRVDLTGKSAPSLSLNSPDGKKVSFDSFRGKPVLVDFWATWCAPCVEAMPKLAHLHDQTKEKGLVLLTIDKDEDAKDATDFLAKRGYTWPNFHDDGEASKAFGGHFGIPRTILIDATGKIVYDGTGGSQDDGLLAAIAGLGPEYAFLSPKPKQEPCVASK